ncbi:3-methyladenine DNA glycosylase [Sutcliffiella deserti]|uniref:3-methyladenine DNA glycosylase n=1 Tax=Sutcliffiella deserti TaxID=2875501 RepID=UPI001CC1363A|nr:3-methyladenine DNA glycosylase [Sutcliffiella deserti]
MTKENNLTEHKDKNLSPEQQQKKKNPNLDIDPQREIPDKKDNRESEKNPDDL